MATRQVRAWRARGALPAWGRRGLVSPRSAVAIMSALAPKSQATSQPHVPTQSPTLTSSYLPPGRGRAATLSHMISQAQSIGDARLVARLEEDAAAAAAEAKTATLRIVSLRSEGEHRAPTFEILISNGFRRWSKEHFPPPKAYTFFFKF